METLNSFTAREKIEPEIEKTILPKFKRNAAEILGG